MNPEPHDYRTPGQLIHALLKEKGWTQIVLGVVLGIDKAAVNRLVSDKRPVDASMALALEELFGIPAEQFLELQKSYDLAKARISARPDPQRATRAKLFGDLPIAEMIKRGWINASDVRDVANVDKSLIEFFGVGTPEQIVILPHAAKKTIVDTGATLAQLAWLYRVKAIASDMMVARYSRESTLLAIKKLSGLLSAPEETRKVPRILMECGIRYVIVESLASSKIDGICFWIDESPVIGMSLRHDRIDNFWFVLRHELEHLLRLHGREVAIPETELEGEKAGTGPNVTEDERIANEAAADFCVPTKMMDGFIARKAPFFAERDILGFARTIHVHPGLVAGQLQHRTERYDRFRNHLVKIRSAIAPSAIVDGWGDVAPVGL